MIFSDLVWEKGRVRHKKNATEAAFSTINQIAWPLSQVTSAEEKRAFDGGVFVAV